jgi:hypothetical protein
MIWRAIRFSVKNRNIGKSNSETGEATLHHEPHQLDQLKIIGFSNGKTLPYLHQEVAYVLHSGRIIGNKAAQVLLDIIQGRVVLLKIDSNYNLLLLLHENKHLIIDTQNNHLSNYLEHITC